MSDAEAVQSAQAAPAAVEVACQSCGTVDVTRAALVASSGLKGLPQASLDWMLLTYGQVPTCLCSACFIPALTNANQAWWQSRPLDP